MPFLHFTLKLGLFAAFTTLALSNPSALGGPQNRSCGQLLNPARRAPSELEREFDRANPEVRAYFSGWLSNGIQSPKHLLSDLLGQKPEANEALRFFSRTGKKYVTVPEIPDRHLEVFRQLQKLDNKEIRFLTGSQTLEVFHAFAHWNLLPSEPLGQKLQLHLATTIPTWKKSEFRSFALLRKLSPMKFQVSFMEKLKPVVISQFSDWSLSTQIEFLSGEWILGEYYPVRPLVNFLETIVLALQAPPDSNPPRIGLLKDLYRGLISFRAREPGLLAPLTGELEGLIELHLQKAGLSLAQGGISGYNNPPRAHIDERLAAFESHLTQAFPNDIFFKEWMDPSVAGFFDPVDYFYPRLHLVIEWDGLHHYFRKLTATGESTLSPLVLRPLDQAKDRALQSLGFTILRVKPIDQDLDERLKHLNSELEKNSY